MVISSSAVIGLTVCPILFIFLIGGFFIVSRKRELSCFRRTDVEKQRRQACVDEYMDRLSSANVRRIKNEDLSEVFLDELHMRDAANAPDRGTSDSLSVASTTVPSLRHANLNSVRDVSIPPPVYIPKT